MPRVRTIQHRFTQGELDPRMLSRTDTDQYYGAISEGLNVFPIPQGGFRRRPGLQFIDRLTNKLTFEASPTITTPEGGVGADANDDDESTIFVTANAISTTNPYIVLHYDLGSLKQIVFIDVVGAFLTSMSSTQFVVQVSTDNAAWLTVGTNVSLSMTPVIERKRVDGQYRYIRFVRIGSTDLMTDVVSLGEFNVWTDSGILSKAKLINFAFDVEETYKFVLSDKNAAIYADITHVADIRLRMYDDTVIGVLDWTQSADTLILFQQDVQPHKIVRGPTDDIWDISVVEFDYTPQFDFIPSEEFPAGTINPNKEEGKVTIQASNNVFSASDVNQFIEGNGGFARIIEFVDVNTVRTITEIPFFSDAVIANGQWSIHRGFEPVWSDTRGWPICGTFYGGRLWLGGSRSRPTTIWGSRIGLFFDFNPGNALDNDAIDISLDTDQLNKIVKIYGGRRLQIFTIGGEHVVVQGLQDPITPATANSQKQTSVGAKYGLQVEEVDGAVYYVQRDGKSIQEFVFDDRQQAFGNNTVTLISSHLVREPIDFALRKSTSSEEGNYIIYINADGSMIIGNILRAQNIAAMVKQTTDGQFINVGVDNEDIFVVVERTIDGVDVRYVERFNNDHFTDASSRITTGLPTDTFSGLDHLEGELCRVVSDGSVMDDATVVSGSFTMIRDAEEYVEIGLNYDPKVVDLPVEIQDLGTVIGNKKNISEVTLQLYNTKHIIINGKELSFKGFGPSGGGSPLDQPVPSFSGTRRMYGFRGWDTTGQITITQDDPLPMTVLSIIKKVNV